MSLIETYYGDSLLIEAVVRRKRGTDAVLDITGCSITFYASNTAAGGDVTIQKEVGTGITITDGPAGELSVQLLPEDTELVGVGGGELQYYLRVTVDADTIHTVSAGELRINRLPS